MAGSATANQIASLIEKKQADKKNRTKLTLQDVNRGLIEALTALHIYGKEVRDEEVLSLIINQSSQSGQSRNTLLVKMSKRFQDRKSRGEIKKVKGVYRDSNGFRVLEPKA